MKALPSVAFEEMSDSAKGATAAKVKNRKYIRNHGYGGLYLVIEASAGQSNGVRRAPVRAGNTGRYRHNNLGVRCPSACGAEQSRRCAGSGEDLVRRLRVWRCRRARSEAK